MYTLTHAILEGANLSYVRLASIEGKSFTMRSLGAANPFIWNTILPMVSLSKGFCFILSVVGRDIAYEVSRKQPMYIHVSRKSVLPITQIICFSFSNLQID